MTKKEYTFFLLTPKKLNTEKGLNFLVKNKTFLVKSAMSKLPIRK